MHSDWLASPGMGTTEAHLSEMPLATEGEATLGPDDEVDVEDIEGIAMDAPTIPEEFELPELDF